MITKEDKSAAIKSTQIHKDDVGSSSAQIAILTARISEITEHMKQAKHDFMARRGLLKLIGRRKKLLKELERKDFAQYKKVIETLGLRK
jgi:small subunit ribosomal protein S15